MSSPPELHQSQIICLLQCSTLSTAMPSSSRMYHLVWLLEGMLVCKFNIILTVYSLVKAESGESHHQFCSCRTTLWDLLVSVVLSVKFSGRSEVSFSIIVFESPCWAFLLWNKIAFFVHSFNGSAMSTFCTHHNAEIMWPEVASKCLAHLCEHLKTAFKI